MGESKRNLGHQQQRPLNHLGTVSSTTFNILAPIYKRLNAEDRESEHRELWLKRNDSILERLQNLNSSIICLQEFWLCNEEIVKMYEGRLGAAGYETYKLPRPNNRGDGLFTAVHQNCCHVSDHKEFLFDGIGDRVAQLLRIELLVHSSANESVEMEKEVLVVNTHLVFPHDPSYCFIRLKQVHKILLYIESYFQECQLPPLPIILCGDWNGSKKGNVYKFLQSQGFVSSYDVVHPCANSSEDCYKWISHHNHRGDVCGVDFIWFRNPSKLQKPLKESFVEAVLGNINSLLKKLSKKGISSPIFLEADASQLTYAQFYQALNELSLSGHLQDGLSADDIKDLWAHLDRDGDGLINLSDFDPQSPGNFFQKKEGEENITNTEDSPEASSPRTTIGFSVSKAAFFPHEVETGKWPENYSLSDHAQLTVEFSLVPLHCS